MIINRNLVSSMRVEKILGPGADETIQPKTPIKVIISFQNFESNVEIAITPALSVLYINELEDEIMRFVGANQLFTARKLRESLEMFIGHANLVRV